jgi:hydrogenase expression/formation protein HypC
MCLAVPGKVIRIDDDGPFSRAGKVDFGGVVREVNLALVPDAGEGDYVLVHVGMAITKVDEEEAARVFETLREMEELGEIEEFGEGRKP